MRDPNYTADWVDSVVLRMRIQQNEFPPVSESALAPTSASSRESSAESAGETEMRLCRFTRSSPESLAVLSSLPSTATIALFTPVLTPASQAKGKRPADFMDPFEPFGRALCQYHKRIRHVPYVPKMGFTDTHAVFVNQADAVVTVVCEPEGPEHPSVSRQMSFAEQAMDAVEDKEASAANTLVLVLCGSDQFRPQADAGFANVVEVSEYNNEVAKELAKTIFRFKR